RANLTSRRPFPTRAARRYDAARRGQQPIPQVLALRLASNGWSRKMDVLAELEDLKHLIRARVPLHIQDRLGFHRRKRRLESRVKADPDIIMMTTGNERSTEGHDWH